MNGDEAQVGADLLSVNVLWFIYCKDALLHSDGKKEHCLHHLPTLEEEEQQQKYKNIFTACQKRL